MSQLELLTYAVYILCGAFVVVLALLIRNELRLKRLLRGKNAHTLEDTLVTVDHELKNLMSFKETSEKRLAQAERELQKSVQHIGVVRFNPFKGTSGSNQSFATAFLTKEGDGVVISSIYSREHVAVFAKPISSKTSSYDLSDEEREALSQATEEA